MTVPCSFRRLCNNFVVVFRSPLALPQDPVANLVVTFHRSRGETSGDKAPCTKSIVQEVVQIFARSFSPFCCHSGIVVSFIVVPSFQDCRIMMLIRTSCGIHDTHSGVLPVDDRCGLDPRSVLPMLGDELVGCAPTASQTLLHLALIKSSGLALKHVCRLSHCQWVVGRILETHTRVRDDELRASCFGLEKCVLSLPFFAHGLERHHRSLGRIRHKFS